MNDVGSLAPVGMNPKAPGVLPGVQDHRMANRHPALTYTFSKHVQMLFSNVQINAKINNSLSSWIFRLKRYYEKV